MLKYELLNIIEFSSDRKRMSVIVKDEKGQIKVLTKGADSIIMKLVSDIDPSTDHGASQSRIRQTTMQSLMDHAAQGLRTLIIAQKIISQAEYDNWNEKLKQA